MNHSRVRSSELSEDYLNAHYYNTEFRVNELTLAKCGYARSTIESLCEKINCGATPKDVVYEAEGCGLIRTTDVRPNQFFTDKVLRTSRLRLNKSSATAAVAGDILYTMSGTIGYAATIPSDSTEVFSFSNTIARARVAKGSSLDSHYISAFFNSRYGYLQSLRLISGGIQGHVMPNPFKKLLVVTPRPLVQKYIGGKVRFSERLRRIGSETLSLSRCIIELLNDGQLSPTEIEDERFSWTSTTERVANPQSYTDGKHDRVSPKQLGHRIDSWFYKPQFVRGDEQLKRLRELGLVTPKIESFASVSYGFMPTEDYWSSAEGAIFLRVTNIQDNLRLDLSKLEYVNPTLSKSARYRLKEDDIICVQCGNSTGRIALISSRCDDWVFPSFALRIRLENSDWDAAYVAGYLASWLGQSQIQRTISITSVRPNTTKPAIEAVTVPKFPLRTQQLIGNRLRIAIHCVEQSVPLCHAANILVEGVIERRISENELVDAQNRLENGDDSADRTILSRLYEGGCDATETRPLFPDLDAYYETLRMVEREQTEVTAK